MSVASVENKQMLLDLMATIIKENKLSYAKDLPVFIEEKCNYFHTQRFEFGSMNTINKKIVELCYNFIMSKQEKQKITSPPTTSSTMSKRAIFNKSLELQTNNFNKLIKPKKPKEIDFADGSKDFPMDNLGVIMNQTLADREQELSQITQQYTSADKIKAEQWLTKDQETTPKIRIDGDSNITISHINVDNMPKKRRVKFNIDEKDSSGGLEGFLSKLKKKPSEQGQLLSSLDAMPEPTKQNKINAIINNQKKILILLEENQENITLLLSKNNTI